MPHEIGSGWGIGNLFGERLYPDLTDKINDVGTKPIFSVEDDLDYKIAKDTFLYNKYLEELRYSLSIVDENFIHILFEDIDKELSPYYEHDEIIEMSNYDNKPTNKELYNNNLTDKKNMLLTRRLEMSQYIY